MLTAIPSSTPSIGAARGYLLVILMFFIGIAVLLFVCMQLYRINKSKHRRPVHSKKRACPTCGLNSLSKFEPSMLFWVVAWYRCSRCNQDFRRYRWNSLLRRRAVT